MVRGDDGAVELIGAAAGEDSPIVLVGFMAVGKSEVGHLLASRLGWEFVDTDARIESGAGRSIGEIFAEEGEARFRALELDVLADIVGKRRCVIATGGGAFASDRARRLLGRVGRTVWLDAPFETVRDRLSAAGPGSRERPLAAGADPVALRALFERRRASYALAEVRVDAALGPAGEVAEAVLRALGQTSC